MAPKRTVKLRNVSPLLQYPFSSVLLTSITASPQKTPLPTHGQL